MNRRTSFLNRPQHEHNNKDDFRTPPYLFHFINERFGGIDYDGACEDGVNNLAAALRLEDHWPDFSTVYSNPPFDKDSILAWFEKGQDLADRGGLHIMLLPEKICQVFFIPMIEHFSEIIFLGGRVDFISPYAVKGGASMNGSIITVQYHRKSTPRIGGILLSELKRRFNE